MGNPVEVCPIVCLHIFSSIQVEISTDTCPTNMQQAYPNKGKHILTSKYIHASHTEGSFCLLNKQSLITKISNSTRMENQELGF